MFEVVKGAEVDVLDEIWDARNLAWVDVDEDVSGYRGFLRNLDIKL